MHTQSEVLEGIKTLAKELNAKDIKWLVGGSSSLLVHKIDVTPNDIDLVIDPADYEKAKTALQTFLTGETEPHHDTYHTPFEVNGISGELLPHTIDMTEITSVDHQEVSIPVYKLEVEYRIYKSRTDKIEKNKLKIELIEKALGIK